MDPDLVTRAQQGDEAAFAAITRSVHERFLQVAFRILRDRHLADDATQQALVRIWQQLPRLGDPVRFDAWSYRVLTNACYTEAKRAKRWRSAPAELKEPIAKDDSRVVHDRDQLERAFARLSLDQRAVVVLHHYLGMTTAEVAETLDIPFGTANSRLGRAMEKLRHALAADAQTGYASSGEPLS